MISLVTIIEFFEALFASIKRRNAEKAAVDAAKTSRLVDDGKAAVADIDAELAKATAKALSGIEAMAAEAAADIVAKVSGAKVTSAQAAKAVMAVMSHG